MEPLEFDCEREGCGEVFESSDNESPLAATLRAHQPAGTLTSVGVIVDVVGRPGRAHWLGYHLVAGDDAYQLVVQRFDEQEIVATEGHTLTVSLSGERNAPTVSDDYGESDSTGAAHVNAR